MVFWKCSFSLKTRQVSIILDKRSCQYTEYVWENANAWVEWNWLQVSGGWTGRCVGWNWTHWIPSPALTHVPCAPSASRHVLFLHIPAECVEFKVSGFFILGFSFSTCVLSAWAHSSATFPSFPSSAVFGSRCSSGVIPLNKETGMDYSSCVKINNKIRVELNVSVLQFTSSTLPKGGARDWPVDPNTLSVLVCRSQTRCPL